MRWFGLDDEKDDDDGDETDREVDPEAGSPGDFAVGLEARVVSAQTFLQRGSRRRRTKAPPSSCRSSIRQSHVGREHRRRLTGPMADETP
jgi:hypothetical protein